MNVAVVPADVRHALSATARDPELKLYHMFRNRSPARRPLAAGSCSPPPRLLSSECWRFAVRLSRGARSSALAGPGVGGFLRLLPAASRGGDAGPWRTGSRS